ncbi:MAG: Lrp/AsnC family transcriptional regulator [Gammaproteobacteria bacterium]|uniref:Lrp/AsnC family transcriptional regulator n=1 Tax=Pseudomaricurvus alcaniphilus TaxID=1166482 RepID=UPI0014097D05|nr:Lrp/AsnC family transcriptional regulator [Pseudomaricurvus alcaniphilus]MBR9910954.1 Lrp/AsnC family transcriptional regulator [Gammaproteobacteria bacterium]NHN37664.1 Lrp/AsnC family transcriptional regulator [Pseudomaricurvus alcaniphilus]
MTDHSQLDDFDIKILKALQENADYSMNELGDLVGLSHTPCWRRIKRLEADGYILGKVTLLNAKQLNMRVSVHAYLTIKSHDEDSLNAFESAVQAVKEVVECYSTTGEKDYLLRIIVSSVDHYEQLLKQTLVHLPNVASINSTFALKQVKYTTALPLDAISPTS